MANKTQLDLLLKDTTNWNNWRKVNRGIKPDLKGADLACKNLRGVSLHWADLSHANLAGANCVSANFNFANLTKADLSEADCAGAKFQWANLSNASLIRTYLGAADLTGATLERTNLSLSIMSRTKVIAVDLSKSIGLDEVKHKAPSSVGIDAIYGSNGKISWQFLRGAGVPDNFIEYMGSLTGIAFAYYSCFISYSTKDQDFAERLYADLQVKGVRCYLATHDLQSGKILHDQIDAAIRRHERVLLIISPHSIHSEWVKTEIAKAHQRQLSENRRVLFPLRLGVSFEKLKKWEYVDPDTGMDLAREIRKFYIPDFTHWKSNDSYREEFTKLIRDLKKDEAAAARA